MTQQRICLIAGLGNPGPNHLLDRHNVGFWLVDALARRYCGEFRPERKFHGDVARIDIEGNDLRLLKPTTYMNRSGLALQALCAYLTIPANAVLVVHDDLDLPTGSVRLKRGGGAGGHNGLRDVIAHLGADFFRLRLGIGRPRGGAEVIDYVLRRASAEDEERILGAIGEALDVLPILLGQGEQRAMNRLHRPKPADDEPDLEGDRSN